MQQSSLFEQPAAGGDARRKVCRFFPDFEGWQGAARQCLRDNLAPDEVWWRADFEVEAAPAPADTRLKVPRAFVDAARAASCHSQEDRWALLYSLLWRIARGERHLMALKGDPQVARLEVYSKAVRRDVHKMKAFVRFREVPSQDGEPRYVAWFEPSHYIVRYAAGFFRRRFANMRWSILTPVGCAHWEGSDAAGGLWFSDAVDRGAAPNGDALEDAWRVYYRSIFNPARVKLQAMRAEMPQKYWKNMPEAHLIPQLVREADKRVAAMQAQRKEEDTLQCGPRPERPADALARTAATSASRLASMAARLQACRDCAIGSRATQAIAGEGPHGARVMLVGEQPGDREDLAGRPFVGPAGQLLDEALAAAGLDRGALYLTNAVKHFKFEPRGKRRIHASPSARELQACLPWVQAELAEVQPEWVVCLGRTAARAMLGREVRISSERGRWIDLHDRRYLVTVHPSALLRMSDKRAQQAAFAAFVNDLTRVTEVCA